MNRLIVAAAVAPAVIVMSPQASASDREIVTAYLDALATHDLDAATDLLSDDFRMVFTDFGFEAEKGDVVTMLGWDVGTNGRFRYEFDPAPGDTLQVVLVERNAFLDHLGLDPIEAEMGFTVSNEAIARITYRTDSASANPDVISQALAPAVAWAREHRPGLLDEIYPNGSIRYSRWSAEQWVQLLRDWRASSGED